MKTKLSFLQRLLSGVSLMAMAALVSACDKSSHQVKEDFIQPIIMPRLEDSERQELNKALLDDARDRLDELMTKYGNSYAADIAGHQKRLDTYLQDKKHPYTDKIVVVDTAKMAVAYALRPAALTLIDALLKDMQGVSADETEKITVARTLTHEMLAETVSLPSRMNIIGFQPLSQHISRTCMLIPGTTEGLPLSAKKLTALQNIAYINGHEEDHCLSTQHDPAFDKDFLKDPKIKNPMSLLAHYKVNKYDQELCADGVSLAQMIRGGAPLSVIDAVIDFRREAPEDYTHYSPPVLEKLKTWIKKKPADDLRGMSDEDLQKQVKDITRANAPLYSYGAMNSYVTRKYARGEKFKPENAMPDTKQAEIFSLHVDRLKDEAARRFGRVTPESMIAAYSAAQQSLRHDIEQAKDAGPLLETAIVLRTAFMRELHKTDFIGESEKRGTNIMAEALKAKQTQNR